MPSADMREGPREEGREERRGEGDEKGITELATLFNQSARSFGGLLARYPPDSLDSF